MTNKKKEIKPTLFGNATAKSRKLRGRLTSMVSELDEENNQTDSEVNSDRIKKEVEQKVLDDKIVALMTKKETLDRKLTESVEAQSKQEHNENTALRNGLTKLMKGEQVYV